MKLPPFIRTLRRRSAHRHGVSLSDARWSSEEVFVSGEHYFASLFLAIQRSEQRVWLESYILKEDPVGQKALALLEEAAKRGVDARLHIDGFGSQDWIRKHLGKYDDASFMLRIYNPVHAKYAVRSLFKFDFGEFWRQIRRVNRRNHRKLAIIDSSAAYVSSMNLCAEPIETVHGQSAWREAGVRVQGSAVQTLAESFERVWTGRVLRSIGKLRATSPIIRDNSTLRGRFRGYRLFLREIVCAQRRILITSAYFVPVRGVRRYLRRAAQRGVDVRILVPAKSDVFFLPWVSRHFFKKFLDAGVKVFEYQHRMVHAKTTVIDDTAWVGSSNLNGRSVFWDLELDVRIQTPASVRILVDQFEIDLQHSAKYEPVALGPWFGIPRLIGYVLLRLSRHI